MKDWKAVGLRETCHACHSKWGECTCPLIPEDQGFEWKNSWVTDPGVSSCGRFFVEPTVYYGAAYIEWLRGRADKPADAIITVSAELKPVLVHAVRMQVSQLTAKSVSQLCPASTAASFKEDIAKLNAFLELLEEEHD